jgi:TRAP-type C4-dicarboxylate transport system substrate-binding protein
MNKDSYNSLPDDMKAVIDEYSGWKALEIVSDTWDEYEVMCRKAIIESGKPITAPSKEEFVMFQAAASRVAEKWIAEMESLSLEGRTIYNQTLELVKKYADN